MNCKTHRLRFPVIGVAVVLVSLGGFSAHAQSKTYERTYHQSAAAVRKSLQQMQGVLSGHLPTLDGFADGGEHPFDRYERAYFQASVQVGSLAGGDAAVRVTVKVTAWYSDPQKAHSGYELLPSNGRIETDILDQLSEQLAAVGSAKPDTGASQVVRSSKRSNTTGFTRRIRSNKPAGSAKDTAKQVSAPQPHLFDAPSNPTASLSRGLAAAASSPPEPEKTAADPGAKSAGSRVRAGLQEVRKTRRIRRTWQPSRNQVRPWLSKPSLSAKPLFLATAHDEFEILNYNQDWVHVRISGLSRGWIWRNDLEMPDSVPDTQAAPADGEAANFFHVVREETAPFPGDWEPLRSKNVKLITVQKIDESAKESGPQLKLQFAKSVFEKSYAEMAQKSADLAGIVLIFDSADGGMIAVPQSVLAKWKTGALSDSGFWQGCFFDPPETFGGGNTAGSAGQ